MTVPRRHASGQSARFSTAVNTDATRSKKAHGRAWSSGILQPSNATAREAFDLKVFWRKICPVKGGRSHSVLGMQAQVSARNDSQESCLLLLKAAAKHSERLPTLREDQ